MSARHDNRDRQGPDTTPFHTYRLGSVVPDNSKGRTPLGTMTEDEIYRGIYRSHLDAYDDDTCQGRRPNPNAKPISLWWLLWPASVAAGVAVWVWLS